MAKKQKLKTHKGAAKRFKKSGTGKILRGSAFKRHLRGSKVVTPGDARKINLMLPYK